MGAGLLADAAAAVAPLPLSALLASSSMKELGLPMPWSRTILTISSASKGSIDLNKAMAFSSMSRPLVSASSSSDGSIRGMPSVITCLSSSFLFSSFLRSSSLFRRSSLCFFSSSFHVSAPSMPTGIRFTVLMAFVSTTPLSIRISICHRPPSAGVSATPRLPFSCGAFCKPLIQTAAPDFKAGPPPPGPLPSKGLAVEPLAGVSPVKSSPWMSFIADSCPSIFGKVPNSAAFCCAKPTFLATNSCTTTVCSSKSSFCPCAKSL
mmetsp:Transcript_2107/g.3571  ORF Transcript_2107/g.3571 Transcript_2107/m.3571 type:complete len:264 (-) Transcript_2107:274-1065(-)